ncbi:ABC transporter ATP-binding protein [Nocardioides sp. Root190]|uniref:ABC transporter ATP-binding protein n=1 Tax=Nocardioides sp. Root190 TaxID=1736488 RepID=UPI00190FC7EC|nr:ABC transporter ATP-binding protein [Nocardioides sp. Root190]
MSFRLMRGQTLGLVGESGSGKTVLARTIMRLIAGANVVTEGEIRFEGRDILSMPDKDSRRLLGTDMAMVFQDPMTALNPVMRLGAQVTEGLRVHKGLSRRDARVEAVRLLEAVHIRDPEARAMQYPHELSGGMRQRVMIATAVACGPKLLIADEPTTALDVTVQARVLDLLDEMRKDLFMAMILVSHDLNVVADRADHLAVMYAGRIVETGPASAVLRAPHMPYTAALLNCTPRLDLADGVRLASIPGRPPSLSEQQPGCSFVTRCEFASQKCREEAPPLISVPDADRSFACWHPLNLSKRVIQEVLPGAPVSDLKAEVAQNGR